MDAQWRLMELEKSELLCLVTSRQQSQTGCDCDVGWRNGSDAKLFSIKIEDRKTNVNIGWS